MQTKINAIQVDRIPYEVDVMFLLKNGITVDDYFTINSTIDAESIKETVIDLIDKQKGTVKIWSTAVDRNEISAYRVDVLDIREVDYEW